MKEQSFSKPSLSLLILSARRTNVFLRNSLMLHKRIEYFKEIRHFIKQCLLTAHPRKTDRFFSYFLEKLLTEFSVIFDAARVILSATLPDLVRNGVTDEFVVIDAFQG